jgi:hypothetical protein
MKFQPMISTLFTKLESMGARKAAGLIALVGMAVAGWVMSIQHGWINDDSVLYFEVARLMSIGQPQLAMQLFPWPFYSALIAIVHSITGHSFQSSAQYLNAVLFGLCCYVYVRLIQVCGGNQRVVLAGALILFSNIYIIGDVLPMLMRDQGFWAFTLMSYVFFISFYRHHQLKDALLWQVCIGIATLFRIEAISLLIALPLIVWFNQTLSYRERFRHYLTSNAIGIIALPILALAIGIFELIETKDLGRIAQIVEFVRGNFISQLNQLNEKSVTFGQNILGSFLKDYSLLGMCAALLAIVIAKVVHTTGFISVLLALIGYRHVESNIEPQAKRILFWVLGIHFINMLLIITAVYVLSGRYIIGFSLVLMIFSSFVLAELMCPADSTVWPQRYRKPLVTVIIIGLLLSFIKIIWPKGPSYNYEQQAVAWVKQRNTDQKAVLYISPRARYYAGEPYIGRGYDYWEYTQSIIQKNDYQRFNYLVINIESEHLKDETELILSFKGYTKTTEFFGSKKKKKLIILKKI